MSETSDQHPNQRTDPSGPSPSAVEELVTERVHDPNGREDLTTSIVGAVADAEGVELTKLGRPPLYDAVDVCALETILFGDPTRLGSSTARTVQFSFHGYRVSVDTSGSIRVFEAPSN